MRRREKVPTSQRAELSTVHLADGFLRLETATSVRYAVALTVST
jgi:hypothetical protein